MLCLRVNVKCVFVCLFFLCCHYSLRLELVLASNDIVNNQHLLRYQILSQVLFVY